MRGRTRYAGAMLLYGPRATPPDLTLVMQFLIDDLRFDGRRVTWVALRGNTLRLRVEGYELVLAHTEGALPPQAFLGVLRPVAGHLADRTDAEAQAGDLARGRVLHSLRHHPCALSVLLRPRGTPPADAGPVDAGPVDAGPVDAGATGGRKDAEPDMLALMRECRALLEPVIEAASPATVIWQPGAVAYTCEEFLANRAEALVLPGDPAHPLLLPSEKERPRHRPALHAETASIDSAVLPGSIEGATLSERGSPRSRSDRAQSRSAGQLFGHTRRPARPVAMPRLHRQDARLAEALRGRPTAAPDPAAKARQRRLNLARVANVTALVLWFMLLLNPTGGIL